MTDPKPCPACAIAAEHPNTGEYRASCVECSTRALAHSWLYHAWLYHASKTQGKMTRGYKEALDAVFGADWEAGHMRVHGWARRIAGTAP